MALTEAEHRLYTRGRAEGRPASSMLAMVRERRAILAEMGQCDHEFLYGPEGGDRFTYSDENSGIHLEWTVGRDYMSPEDEDWADAEDLKAWADDEWHYYWVSVTGTLGRYSVSESLGGIVAGDYFDRPGSPLDTEQQIWQAISEYGMGLEAMREATQAHAIAEALRPFNA